MNLEKNAQLAFFNGLATADVRLLEPFFAPQSWVAGTLIFEQGDYADYLYLVAKGEVTIRYRPDDGPAITVTRVQPGGIFGWSAAMGHPSYTCQAICALDSEVLRIRGTDLRMLCDKHTELGKVILARLTAVIAERKQSQQMQVSAMLANGIHQQPKGQEQP